MGDRLWKNAGRKANRKTTPHSFPEVSAYAVRTGVNADAQQQFVGRPVTDAERLDLVQQPQRHAADFARVQKAVWNRQTGHDHVRVAYRLHLQFHAVPFNNVGLYTVMMSAGLQTG